MEWVQTTGATVEEALDAALDELGVHEEDVELEVLEEPRSGFLGRFGGSEARIRVRLKPISREKPNDRRRGRAGKSKRGDGGRGRQSGRGDRRAESPARPERPQRGERRQKAEQSEGETTTVEETVTIEEQAASAEEFVAGLVAAIGLEGDITSSVDEDVIEVQVEGGELGLLVGPKGQTLSAIEELTRSVVQKGSAGSAPRVRVDVGGYRAKRRAALEDFTRRVVDEVIASGEPRALEPMGSVDRKTVHDVVNDLDGVETSSEGEDPRRYVVIRPA